MESLRCRRIKVMKMPASVSVAPSVGPCPREAIKLSPPTSPQPPLCSELLGGQAHQFSVGRDQIALINPQRRSILGHGKEMIKHSLSNILKIGVLGGVFSFAGENRTQPKTDPDRVSVSMASAGSKVTK
jgi:hypothetical protein